MALDANDKIRYFQVLSSQLWAYRFLHRDVYHLVETNEDFRQNVSTFCRTGHAAGAENLSGLCGCGSDAND